MADRGRDDNAVKGRLLRPAVITICCADRDVVIAEALQTQTRFIGQFPDNLDTEDLRDKL